MVIKNELKLGSEYNIKLIRDGQVRESYDFHNLFLNSFTGTIGTGVYLGSDATPPAVTDTGIKKQVDYAAGAITERINDLEAGVVSITVSATFTTGIGKAYSVAEVYISHGSRALVTDSEGNPITINKTEYDEIILTAKFTCTNNGVMKNTLGMAYPGIPSNSAGNSIGFCTKNAMLVTSGKFTYMYDYYNGRDGRLPTTTTAAGAGSIKEACTSTNQWNTTITKGYVLGIGGQASCNSYSNYRTNAVTAWFPNTDIFPVRTLIGLSLGTGDGTETDFVPELPWWLENTEKVYKNGVLLARDVDYVADPFSMWAGDIAKTTSICYFVLSGMFDYTPKYEDNTVVPFSYWANLRFTGTKPIICKVDTSMLPYNCVNFIHRYDRTLNYKVQYSLDNGNTWEMLDDGTAKATSTFIKLDAPIYNITHIKFSPQTEGSNFSAYTSNNFFGYVGDYAIRFIDPPADGDVLTMDCDIDRPWLNGKEILDVQIVSTLSNV